MGQLTPRSHSCQSKQSQHISHKGVVTRWTSTNCRRLFRADTWQCTCSSASCPSLYRCALRSIASLRSLFALKKTCHIRWHYLFVWISFHFAKRCKSSEFWDSKLPRGIFCFRPANVWRPVRGVPLWFMNLCLTCYTFEDPSELSCRAKTCWYLLGELSIFFLKTTFCQFCLHGTVKRDGRGFRIIVLTPWTIYNTLWQHWS